MRKINSLLIFLIICCSSIELFAQSVVFPDDARKRGYYDRPYKRYEAEPGKCQSDGLFLSPSYTQSEIQSEASNAMATQLIKKGSYIQWTNDEAADGMVIRFSLPDGEDGLGIKGKVALYVNDKFVQDITLNSFWAWAWLDIPPKGYPGNEPGENKFARMRYDDVRVKLADKIAAGSTFKLVKVEDNDVPYTIDFVELEPIPAAVTFESINDPNKVKYVKSAGSLDKFIADNGGKTIYIPEGVYDVSEGIVITAPNTKLIGAGMWYTNIYFSASTDDINTYNKRGISSRESNVLIDGLYLTTANHARYHMNDSKYQVGKGLMGSYGTGSVVKNVWIEHFECGGWINGTQNLTVQHCRFRNNYADGINLASGSKNSVVEHCSFRNNGDDDMASWSSGALCENITYQYNTAENNWRASSIGFFGGRGHKALNCVVIDPMEAALRVTTDFPGKEFSTDGFILFDNISTYKAGCADGPVGFKGDIINGSGAGAIHVTSYSCYDIQNVKFSNIDLYDSKNDAIFIGSRNGKVIKTLYFENINIDGAGRYGMYFHNTVGEASYCNLKFNKIAKANMAPVPGGFRFEPMKGCQPIK